jgi:hypothetical protein
VTFMTVVQLCLKFGLEGIGYGELMSARGDIYIGSYGYNVSPYLPVESKAFRDVLVNSSFAEAKLIEAITGPESKKAYQTK